MIEPSDIKSLRRQYGNICLDALLNLSMEEKIRCLNKNIERYEKTIKYLVPKEAENIIETINNIDKNICYKNIVKDIQNELKEAYLCYTKCKTITK